MSKRSTKEINRDIEALKQQLSFLRIELEQSEKDYVKTIGNTVKIKVNGKPVTGKVEKVTDKRVHIKVPNIRILYQRAPHNVWNPTENP